MALVHAKTCSCPSFLGPEVTVSCNFPARLWAPGGCGSRLRVTVPALGVSRQVWGGSEGGGGGFQGLSVGRCGTASFTQPGGGGQPPLDHSPQIIPLRAPSRKR